MYVMFSFCCCCCCLTDYTKIKIKIFQKTFLLIIMINFPNLFSFFPFYTFSFIFRHILHDNFIMQHSKNCVYYIPLTKEYFSAFQRTAENFFPYCSSKYDDCYKYPCSDSSCQLRHTVCVNDKFHSCYYSDIKREISSLNKMELLFFKNLLIFFIYGNFFIFSPINRKDAIDV